MEKAKFEKGDRVKCVGDFDLEAIREKGEIDDRKIGHGWRKDLIFTITDRIKERDSVIYWKAYDNCGVYEERLIGLDKQLTIE